MTRTTLPDSCDSSLLELYLNDHIAGATGGRARMRRMAKERGALRRADPDGDLGLIARELDEEFNRLRALIRDLGLRRLVHRQLAAAIGERLARLKPNRRLLGQSPMTPFLELELMRGAVNGKKGLWELVVAQAEPWGLDPAPFAELVERAERQSERLAGIHARLAPGVFTKEPRG